MRLFKSDLKEGKIGRGSTDLHKCINEWFLSRGIRVIMWLCCMDACVESMEIEIENVLRSRCVCPILEEGSLLHFVNLLCQFLKF